MRAVLGERIRILQRRRRQVRLHGTPEAIHDVRVATRRLQEALDMFAPSLPARERERLRRRARRIRRSLADVRDADVLIDLVRRLRERPGGRAARGLATFERRLLMSAAGLRHRLGLFTGSAGLSGQGLKIRGIRKRAEALLLGPFTPAERRTERAAARVLGARTRAVRAALGPARSGRAAALHRLRVAVKRYRYCLETLEAWGRGALRPEIARTRTLQERLGAVHDLDMLIGMVRGTRGVVVLRYLRSERRRLAAEARAALEGFRPLAARAAQGRLLP